MHTRRAGRHLVIEMGLKNFLRGRSARARRAALKSPAIVEIRRPWYRRFRRREALFWLLALVAIGAIVLYGLEVIE